MPAHRSKERSLVSRVAALQRHRGPDDPGLIEAKRALHAEQLADYITRTVDAAPPLSAAQLDRLGALLRPVPAAGGGPHAAA